MTPFENAETMRSLARAGRRAVREVWARRHEKEHMSPGEREVAEQLERHEEFREYWEGREPDEHLNPFLHVQLHQVLETQARQGDPPEVARALERLVAQGRDRHEAEHEVLRVLLLAIQNVAQAAGPFDREGYVRNLERLGRRS
ncbi:MAG: DUF1841 family protein [Acidobacteriota bacterium]|nr:DUF1841 family protein [Acidobacteriota bacterium]MDQ7087221.1 DUF1841 family protein [Acidobacteriota bacterium]